jgi:SAM-dependent methyltransferase
VDIDENPLLFSRQVTERKHFVEPHIPGFAEYDKWAGRGVLDLGCGIGTDAIEFARTGANVTALDVSERSINIAHRRADAEDVWDRILFINDNAERPGLLFFHEYDLVYSFGVIHHTPNPEAILKNVRWLLRPGGEFRLMVYNRLSWKVFWILATYGRGRFWRWRELVARHSEAQNGCPITRTYTKSSIRKLLESNGFSVEDISVAHIFPYKVSDYIQHKYTREWYWRLIPKWLFRWLERHIGWHMLIKARRKDCKE